MDIPLPGEPDPVALIPTPSSPNPSKTALHTSNDYSISSRAESFYSDIPMPSDEKLENQDRLSRYSPSEPFLEDEPMLPRNSPVANHANRFLVLGKLKAKKRLLAFSATKQAGGAGLMFNLLKKTVVKPILAKGFEQLTEDGDLTPDTSLLKKKPAGKKGAPKEDKAKAVVSAIEEIKREELMMRGAFRMATGGSSEAIGGTSLQRQQARKKEGDMYSLIDSLLTDDKDKEKEKDRDKDKDKEKKSRSKSRKHRSSSDKKSERHGRDKDKDKAKDKQEKEKEKSKGREKSKTEICQLPTSWAEFRSRKMNFDQIRHAKEEVVKKTSGRHSSRSKDSQTQEQFEKELCNPLDFPARCKKPFKAVGARQREKLYSQDMVHYTKTVPVISYSANPDILSSRYRNRSEIFSFATPTAVSIMNNVIKSKEKEYVKDLKETDASSTRRRLWYDPLDMFMQPRDSEMTQISNPSPHEITELQPTTLSDVTVKTQLDQEIKVFEIDSDPSAISDIACSKWDSEFEDEVEPLTVVPSQGLKTSLEFSPNLLVDDASKVASDVVSPVVDICEEDEVIHTNTLRDDGANTSEQQGSPPSTGAPAAKGGDPDLVNEYEEFMKSVSVNSEETNVSRPDQYPPTSSEIINDEVLDSKKRKRQRLDSQNNSKVAGKMGNSSKKSTSTKKDKKKRKPKISKKVRRISTTSSSSGSTDDNEDEKPRIKRRKIKTKKSKLRSWKKNKKRKKQASSSSSDEISSSSVSSDSSESDSSLEDSSSSEERISKKRSKKGTKKKKIVKKGKQKKTKKLSKEDKPEKSPKATKECVPAKNETNSSHSKDSINELVEGEGLGKDYRFWGDVEETGKDQVMDTNVALAPLYEIEQTFSDPSPILSESCGGSFSHVDSGKQWKPKSNFKIESDDLEEFSTSAKILRIKSESSPLAVRFSGPSPIPLSESRGGSYSREDSVQQRKRISSLQSESDDFEKFSNSAKIPRIKLESSPLAARFSDPSPIPLSESRGGSYSHEDSLVKRKRMSSLQSESDDMEEFSNSAKILQVQSESSLMAVRLSDPSPIALAEGSGGSYSHVISKLNTSSEAIKDILPTRSNTEKLFKGNDSHAIESTEDNDFLDTAIDNRISQTGGSRFESAKGTESNFSRLGMTTSEAWENDSQQKWDTERKSKFGGEWEDAPVNWFKLKGMAEEREKSPVDLMPSTRLDVQNNSSLSDDLNQEVGKRSLRELKYLRDVIKNEVVDEGAKLGSPKPIDLGDATMSLGKTTMVTSFVTDFSKHTDYLPVEPPCLEKEPAVSDLYSPGQEDDKSTRSNSPQTDPAGRDLYEIFPEESKSDMSLDSPGVSDYSDEFDENSFLNVQKRQNNLMGGQFLSLGSIPLPPKTDLQAIEVPETSSCLPTTVESPSGPASATGNGKIRSKENQESSLLPKPKHVITVKLLPSELRFKNIETAPKVTGVVVNEIIPRSDLKTGWKAIGGPDETVLPIKTTVKKPSRWSSVPCAVIDHENPSSTEDISSMQSSTPNKNEALDAEVSKEATEVETPSADFDSSVDVSAIKNGSCAAVSEADILISESGSGIKMDDKREQMLPHSSGEISILGNLAPPGTDELKQAKVPEHNTERSDKDREGSKKTDNKDRDNSKRQGSRSRDDSKRRDNREKDTKRKEERSKDDPRKGDSQGRSDSRSRDRHKSESRRDRRDVKRSRDDRRRSPDRSEKRRSPERSDRRHSERRSPGRRSAERSDRRRRSNSRENSRRRSRKRSPNHDRLRSSENKDDSRSNSHKSAKDNDKRRSERSPYNANGDSLINIPLPDIQHHNKDDCCSMDMECCSPVSTFSPLVGLKRSVADSTTISDEELKLANSEQKSSLEDYSKQCYSPMQSSESRNAAKGNAPTASELEFSPKRLSLDERLELELGLRLSPRRQLEQPTPLDAGQYQHQCYWPNQPGPPDGSIRPLLPTPGQEKFVGPQPNQFVGGPSNFYGQQQQQRLHNFMGAMNSPLMPANPENNYPANVRWDHVPTYPGIPAHPDRPLAQPLQQVVVPEKQFLASVPIESYVSAVPLPVDLANRPLAGSRPLSPRVLPANIPKVVLIPPMMAPMAVQPLLPPQDYIHQTNSVAESDMHVVHKFYPEASIYADIPSDTESEQKIFEMLTKAKKRSLGRKAAHKQKENIRKREILKARELKKKKLAKYKKAILHEGDTLRRSVTLDLEEMRLNTGSQPSPKAGTSTSDFNAFSPIGNFAPLPAASKGILISIGFGLGNDSPLKERRKSVMFADGVRPGEGTSPSAGEDPLSPTLFVPKEKKLRKKKKKIKVHVIRQLSSDESTSDSDAIPPPPPPPGSPPPELKPYSFPGPSPGKMILRLSKRIALGASRVPRVVLLGPAALKLATAPAPSQPDTFARSYSDEKTLKLIAYHQAMIAIKGQAPLWSAGLPCQTVGGTVLESKPQLPHSTNIVMKALASGQADLFDQGNGNGPSYPPNTSLGLKSSSSLLGTPVNSFLDTMGGSCAAPPHVMFGEPKVPNPSERIPIVSAVPSTAFGVHVQYGLQPPLPQSPQLRNPPPPPPPLPIPKAIATASNPKN